MEDFAGLLQTRVLDKPVIDRTGLTGRYDFTLEWKTDDAQFTNFGIELPAPKDSETRTDIFSAFQQQLGLRLQSGKAPVDILVIDHVEHPTDN